jgi:hypothetical protein
MHVVAAQKLPDEVDATLCSDVRVDDEAWITSTGSGCGDYEALQLCTADGDPGYGWDDALGALSDWVSSGLDATQACCACGGGVVIPLEDTNAETGGACDDLRDEDNGAVWRSSTGSGCEVYGELKLCTPDGQGGEGWDDSFGSLSDWSTAGFDATQVTK